MKKILSVVVLMFLIVMLVACGAQNTEIVNNPEPTDVIETNTSNEVVTKELAFEGVNNYCKNTYDWSPAEEDPSIMYVQMDEETDTEYKVTFRSYTGSFVYFYVNKADGNTRLVEYVPTLDIEEDAGTINIFDYIDAN